MTATLKKTAGKYAVDELHTILALHAIAVSEMAQGLCVLDAELRIVLFNRRFVEILGVGSKHVRVGLPMRAVLAACGEQENPSGPAAAGMWNEIEQLLVQGAPFRLRRRVRTNAVIAFDFRPTTGLGWVLTCEQPNEQSASAAPQQPDFLKEVIEHVSHGLCVFDGERNLVLCNEQFLQVYGFDPTFGEPGVSFGSIFKRAASLGIFSDATADKLEDELDRIVR